jgi:hypothetical protein
MVPFGEKRVSYLVIAVILLQSFGGLGCTSLMSRRGYHRMYILVKHFLKKFFDVDENTIFGVKS